MGYSSSATNLPYQRLTDEDDDVLETRRQYYNNNNNTFKRVVSLNRKRRRRFKVRFRFRVRMRVRVLSFMKRRTEELRCGILKALKTLKESQAYFGDLFAGNYLFMQVNPTSLKYVLERSSFQGQSGNVVSKIVPP